MPALLLFRRRWLISGDDLVFPALQLSTFHLAWTVTLAIWMGKANGVADSCASKSYYAGVVGSTLATCSLSVVLEPAIAFYGSRGGMFESKKRSPMLQWCIYADLLMSVLRICITGYGTHVLYAYPSECLRVNGSSSFSLPACYRAMLWSMWAMIGGLTCFCVLVYNWFPDYDDPVAWVRHFDYLSYWFCCVSGSRLEVRESFRRLGELFGMIFRHIDLVPTDVITIFFLAMLRQRIFRLGEEMSVEREDHIVDAIESGRRHRCDPPQESSFSISQKRRSKNLPIDSRGFVGLVADGQVDQATVEDVAYYMRYAFAVYGWMLFVWAHPYSGIAKLCCGRSCSMCADCLQAGDGIPDPRNARYLNREAILKTSRLDPGDLLHVQLEGRSKDVLPFFIGLDHAKKKLIIAIRGSMSFDDVVRDLKFDPACLDDWLASAAPESSSACAHPPRCSEMNNDRGMRPENNGRAFYAHRGIFEAARATMASIKSTGILEKHLSPTGIHRDYGILVCGHSLGAGCAFLVGAYLKRSYRTLQCISFSPPGGLVCKNLASSAAEWCVSTVCGKEWIPRLTLSTIEHMRDDMVHLGIYCRMSKAKLIVSWLTGYLWADEDVFYTDESLPEENSGWLKSYEESVGAPDGLRQSLLPAFDFHPPGRILYLKPTGKTKGRRLKRWEKSKKVIMQREFVCEWTTGERLVSNGILLSGRMMWDHFPDVSFAILRVLAAEKQRRSFVEM